MTTTPTPDITTTRHATLADLTELLQQQRAQQCDVVAAATAIRSRDGVLLINGAGEPVLDEQGVTPTTGRFRPTAVCDEGFAAKLDIPVGYLRRLRRDRPDLYDLNINALLHGRHVRRAGGHVEVIHPADDRTFLMRLLRADTGDGVARAVLSDRYKVIDNLDILTAVLTAVRQSGVDVQIAGADLSERRMYLDVQAPAVAALAPVLLGGYRNPFADPATEARRRGAGRTGDVAYWRRVAAAQDMGYQPGTEPIMFAGFRVSNSEVGDGKFTLAARLIARVCRNGLTMNQDVISHVHLGEQLDSGIVGWSAQTHRRNLELIMSKTRDAVATFLDIDYLTSRLEKIEADAGTPVAEPEKTVTFVARTCGFTKAETDDVLGFFIRGGQLTAGGIANAITAYSQTVADPDRANALDTQAVRAMQLVA
jgi:hypothetical protein